MLGAIAGDIIGSVHEFGGGKTKDFVLFHERCQFTDDSVLTVAVAEHLLRGGEYVDLFHDYFHRYPRAGFGGRFHRWASERRREPYQSYGNGSAMRVSAVGIVFDTLDDVRLRARESAVVTHDHPEGIRGAEATAAAVFLARSGRSQSEIRQHVESEYGYDLSRTLDSIREGYRFDETCPGSVPEAITAFLEARDYEDAVRNAISLGGDADTLACIAGGIAEAFYGGVPRPIAERATALLDDRLRGVVSEFYERYGDRITRS